MSRLNLKAETEMEKVILGYLEENASDVLAEKMNAGEKTIKSCIGYITSEARKMAVGNAAMVDDKTVFGWAVHYFEEDSIKAEQKVVATVKRNEPVKEEKKVVKEVKAEKKQDKSSDQLAGQTSIFDFLGV